MNRFRSISRWPLLVLCGLLSACAHAPRPSRDLAVPNAAGQLVHPFAHSTQRAVVFVFLANECPVANRAIPELRRLHAALGPRGVTFWFVHPNGDESDESVRRHAAEYELPGMPLRDPGRKLVRFTNVKVTPTAVVLSPAGDVLYRGRIDDRYAALGQARPAPTRHDLERALEAVLAGRNPEPAETPAVGCHLAKTP